MDPLKEKNAQDVEATIEEVTKTSPSKTMSNIMKTIIGGKFL
jgi:hypothetical protein